MKRYVLAVDQGTTGTTCLVLAFGEGCVEVVSKGYAELPQHFPQPGWVEHDLNHIWTSVKKAMQQALLHSNIKTSQIEAVGITNQRETTGVWDEAGTPYGRALVWQDRRTSEMCLDLKKRGHAEYVQQTTGLVLDPYFSATKLAWILQDMQRKGVRVHEGYRFGTMDTWVLFCLTGGQEHKTDASNASRTSLWDIHAQQWDSRLLEVFDVPYAHMLPQVCASDAVYGYTKGLDVLPDGIPVAGIAGDQQAALFGQACFEPGMTKCTYGTGAFALMNTGEKAFSSKHGLLTTVAWKCGSKTTYALEGSTFVAGALVQWLRDGLKIIQSSAEVEALALQVEDNGEVCVIPALTGLGAPYWRPEARGLIAGVTRGTTHAHIARAALEGIAFQSAGLFEAMEEDGAQSIGAVRVDGGASANNLLMQIQADSLNAPVQRASAAESTALGAGFFAALGVGVVSSQEALASMWKQDKVFVPSERTAHTQEALKRWRQWVLKA